MNASEILELVRAGYSKEEITKMTTPDGEDHKDSPNEPDPAPDSSAPEHDETNGTGNGEESKDDAQNGAGEATPDQLPNNPNAAELEAIKAQIAAQTADLKSLKEQLIDKRINEGTAKKEEINIYDFWANTLNT